MPNLSYLRVKVVKKSQAKSLVGRFIAEAVKPPNMATEVVSILPSPSPTLLPPPPHFPSLASPHKPQGINLFTGHNLSIAAFIRLKYLLYYVCTCTCKKG
jgi:hypothetical protein